MFLNKDIKILINYISLIMRDLIKKIIIINIKYIIDYYLIRIKDLKKYEWDIIRFWFYNMKIYEFYEKFFWIYYSNL